MTSDQVRWYLLDQIAGMGWLPVMLILGLSLMGVSFRLKNRTIVVRQSWAYALLAGMYLMFFIAAVGVGAFGNAVIRGVFCVAAAVAYHLLRKGEDGGDDGDRRPQTGELGDKARVKIRKMLEALKPSRVPVPVPGKTPSA